MGKSLSAKLSRALFFRPISRVMELRKRTARAQQEGGGGAGWYACVEVATHRRFLFCWASSSSSRFFCRCFSSEHRRDPGIPNSCPFKQDIIRTIQLRKQQNEASRALFFERQKQQEQKCSGGSGVVGQMSGEGATLQDSTDLCHSSSPALSGKPAEDSPSSLALQSLMDAATAGQAKYHAWEQGREDSSTARGCAGVAMTAPQEHYLTQQGRQQHQLLRRVLQQADVIVEVLDARMPDAFRCPALERWILGAGKKLILVMNKVDLVPKEAAVAWLKALQKGIAPALAFKCAGGSAGARKRGIKRGGKRKLKNWTDVEPLEASDHLRK